MQIDFIGQISPQAAGLPVQRSGFVAAAGCEECVGPMATNCGERIFRGGVGIIIGDQRAEFLVRLTKEAEPVLQLVGLSGDACQLSDDNSRLAANIGSQSILRQFLEQLA